MHIAENMVSNQENSLEFIGKPRRHIYVRARKLLEITNATSTVYPSIIH